VTNNVRKAHIDHLHALIEEFHRKMEPKYLKGQKEHGGNLWELTDEELEFCELEEIVDLAVYRLTRLLKKKGGDFSG